MHPPNARHPLRAIFGATLAALLIGLQPSAQAALTLYKQPLSLDPDAAAGATLNQTNPLVETFSFTGTAQTLSWWGTDDVTLQVSLYAGDNLAALPVRTQTGVSGTPTGDSIAISDGNGDPQSFDVFRYSIDLGALTAGAYTLTVIDIAADDEGLSWYWLYGSGGDGLSSSVDEFGVRSPNSFDLSLLVEGERRSAVPEPAMLALLAAAALAGRPRRHTRPTAA
jgi:hypothetical protein